MFFSLVHLATQPGLNYLNVGFEADWQYIKTRKQNLINKNNERENAKRIPHTYNVGDEVMVRQDPSRKYGSERYTGPYSITKVYDNGTVRLKKATRKRGGAVYQTWNIRQITPCKA